MPSRKKPHAPAPSARRREKPFAPSRPARHYEPIGGLSLSPRIGVREMLSQFRHAGLQASQVGKASELLDEMQRAHAVVFLTFTTNLVTSGLREVFADLCKKKKVQAIITAIGSIEEDVMKSDSPFHLATFDEDDWQLRAQGLNRVGNILIPNDAYIRLEKKLVPFFEAELQKQKSLGRLLAPHELIRDLGLTLNDEHSFVCQAAKNRIPIFCPAPTDGAFGLQLYFFRQAHPEFGIDVAGDLKPLGQMVLDAEKTAGIILGGGVAKHHAIGANLLREGFDYALYISTGTPYDGSLSGARTREAISWGKISPHARTVHVEADASIVFPLLAAGLLD